jgi:hypothetical protein
MSRLRRAQAAVPSPAGRYADWAGAGLFTLRT